MPPINHAGRARLSPLGLILLAVTSIGWGLNFPIICHAANESGGIASGKCLVSTVPRPTHAAPASAHAMPGNTLGGVAVALRS